MVRHYGHNYSIISEKSKRNTLRFYALIESLYGGNHFMVVVQERNKNFNMTPIIHKCLPLNLLLDLLLQGLLEAGSQELLCSLLISETCRGALELLPLSRPHPLGSATVAPRWIKSSEVATLSTSVANLYWESFQTQMSD